MTERDEKAEKYILQQKIKKLKMDLEFVWRLALLFLLMFVMSIGYQLLK